MNDTSVVCHPSQGDNDSEFACLRFPLCLAEDFPRNIFLGLLRKFLSHNLLDKLRILLELPLHSPKLITKRQETFIRDLTVLENASNDPFEKS